MLALAAALALHGAVLWLLRPSHYTVAPAVRPSPWPLPPGTLTMREAMRYVLSLPVSTVIVGCDTVVQLEENVQLARAFTPLSDSQMAELVQKAQPVHQQALFFRRWEGQPVR